MVAVQMRRPVKYDLSSVTAHYHPVSLAHMRSEWSHVNGTRIDRLMGAPKASSTILGAIVGDGVLRYRVKTEFCTVRNDEYPIGALYQRV